MLMYEKDGKLILNFQKGSIPQEVKDVQMYKQSDVVHVMIGNNDLGNAILQGLDIDKDNSSAFSSATRYLSNAISEFKSALNELDNLNVPAVDYQRLIKRFNSRLVDCLAYINYTKEYIDQFIPKSIDDIEIEISDDDWSEFE